MKRLPRCLSAGSALETAPDQLLLEQFATGRDEAAFAELVRRHGPLVWGVCRRNLVNPPDAEDAFQASFLVLVRRSTEVTRYADLGPWLYKVAASCCKTVQRTNRRRLRRVRPGLNNNTPAPVTTLELDLADILDTALLSLPEKYRTPIILCHLQGWTRRQAAERLGCPEGTLSIRLNRALAKLRSQLADRDLLGTLAVAGAMAAPSAVIDAAVRTFVIYTTSVGEIPPTVLNTTNGVLRMLRLKKLKLLAATLLVTLGMVWLGTELLARSHQQIPQANETLQVRRAEPSSLVSGKWELIDWMAPHMPRREAALTISEQSGKQVITEVEGENFKFQLKELVVNGKRVTFTITRQGNFDQRFDGLIDPADATRVLGSIWHPGSSRRATLELVPAAGSKKLKNPELPPEWKQYLEQANVYTQASVETSGERFEKKSKAEQDRLRQVAKIAEEKFYSEIVKLFRKLVAERANTPFGYEAAMELFSMFDRLKPTPLEVDEWAKTASTFAATHGPQFEADTVRRIAGILIRQKDYIDQAKDYAVKADELAKAAGMPAGSVKHFDEYAEERTTWARQTNPPAPGTIWTVTVTGCVKDTKGNPVADAEVLVNRTSWVKRIDWKENMIRTGPDGKYTLTLKCEGSYRLHIHHMWAAKKGFVRVDSGEVLKLLPGQVGTVDFTIKTGEAFGGTLKVRPDAFERSDNQFFLEITGPGISESVLVKNGEKFELCLPSGEYTVELDRTAGKKLAWKGLKSGRTDHLLEQPPFRYTPETVGAAFDEMWQVMDHSYSYFALKPDVDWAKLKEEYRPKAARAKTVDELAQVLKEMLARLKDGHVWIEMPDGKVIGTHRTDWQYNGNRKVIMDQLTDVTECGEYALVGKTKPDGYGYFLMTLQSAATPELVEKAQAAIAKLAEAPGFIVDLRNANGGSEPLAQKIAAMFCEKAVVYAKSRYRDGKGHDQFTADQERTLSPSSLGKPYLKPVVCLLGSGCVSSGEGFAKMMAVLPHVTTVGLPTRGSSGNPGLVDVGESGLIVYFSQWVDLLPNGTPIEGKGIPPKIRVEMPLEAYKDADPTLAKGFEILREKQKLKSER